MDEIKRAGARTYGYFSRVKEAREYLKEKAKELIERQERLIEQAAEKGEMEAALKANQWLIEHMPKEEGVAIIDESAAKVKEIETSKGPQIAIGIQLGGMSVPSLPPAQVIDVKTDEDE